MEGQKTFHRFVCGNVLNFQVTMNLLLLPQPTLVSVLRDQKIRYAAAGVSHSIFIDASGRVYTCGKGNGLLGYGDMRMRTVPMKITALKVGENIKKICIVRMCFTVRIIALRPQQLELLSLYSSTLEEMDTGVAKEWEK